MRPDSHNTPDPQRLSRLEESLGYLENDTSRSRDQFDELSKAVHELSSRMQRLESRLMDLHTRIESGDQTDPGLVPPPHSAGPDIPRDPL